MSLIPASFIEKSWRGAIAQLDHGTLHFVAPNGEVSTIKAPLPGPEARFHIHSWDVLRRIMARGDIGLGEEYIAGSWDTDNIEALVSLFLLNLDRLENFSDGNFLNRIGFVLHNALVRRNSIAGSARNIKAHYDVGNDFYRLWLDRSMTYSSALYAGAAKDTQCLEDAQQEQIWPHPGKIPESQSFGAGNRLRLGRLRRARRSLGPPCHRSYHIAGAARLCHPKTERRRRHQAGRLSQSRARSEQYRLDRNVRGGRRTLLAAIFRLRGGAP